MSAYGLEGEFGIVNISVDGTVLKSSFIPNNRDEDVHDPKYLTYYYQHCHCCYHLFVLERILVMTNHYCSH